MRNWQRNPMFYIDQALGPLYETLVVPPPFSADRARHLVRSMANINALVAAAKVCIGDHDRVPICAPEVSGAPSLRIASGAITVRAG